MKPLSLLSAFALLLAVGAPAFACASPDAGKHDAEKMMEQAYMVDRQGDYKQAEDIFRQVIAYWPDNRKAHYLLANTYWRDNMMAESRREWETVLRGNQYDHYGQDARDWLKDNGGQATGAVVSTTLKSTGGFADGPLAQARFNTPSGLALAANGDLYVADAGNHRIRKVTQAGVVSTVAGSGKNGYMDGPAGKAALAAPKGLAFDPAGNLYFIDGNRVRFVTPTGLVGTLAGGSEAESKDGDWKTARFAEPVALAVDSHGLVYVAEGKTPTLRVVTPQGDSRLLAGGEAGFADGVGAIARFQAISDLAIMPSGDLLVVDAGSNRLRKVSPTGEVTSLSNCPEKGYVDGPVALAQFRQLSGATVDSFGEIFFGDAGSHSVRAVTAKGTVLTLAGGVGEGSADGVGIDASFKQPGSMAVKGDALYVLDTAAGTVRKISKE